MSYVPHTDADRRAMLETIGVANVEGLFEPLPPEVRLKRDLDLPAALDEHTLLRHMRGLATRNIHADEYPIFLGAGIYDHFVPAVVDALASQPEFATAYTPYQPEVSQGMLQALYEYQSLICRLTGMDLANASMYDGATALAEAALMAIDVTGRDTVVISRAVHPSYREVVATYVRTAGYRLVEIDYDDGGTDPERLRALLDDRTACVAVQHPSFFGCLEDVAALTEAARAAGALSIVATNPISLGLLRPPGDHDVDIVVGEGQALGCSMGFGGPLLGFFACKLQYLRRFPGRIVGATTDREGRRGYTMTLRTREQDIRREKATSNICTNETLLALGAAVYMCALGKQGLREVADLCLQKAHYAHDELTRIGGVGDRFTRPFFHEFAVRLPAGLSPQALNARLLDAGIVGGYALGRTYPELDDCMLLCVTETRTRQEIDRLVEVAARGI